MAVKKLAKGRRPAADAKTNGLAPSAKERRESEAQLKVLIARFAPEQSGLIKKIRLSLRKRLPTAHEVVYEYRDGFVISLSPSLHGYEGVFAIRGGANEVKLYFNRGKELPDPAKLLKGSGGLARYLLIENPSVLNRPEVIQLIEGAIACNRVPFAEHGRGTITVRATTAQRKRNGSQSTD